MCQPLFLQGCVLHLCPQSAECTPEQKGFILNLDYEVVLHLCPQSTDCTPEEGGVSSFYCELQGCVLHLCPQSADCTPEEGGHRLCPIKEAFKGLLVMLCADDMGAQWLNDHIIVRAGPALVHVGVAAVVRLSCDARCVVWFVLRNDLVRALHLPSPCCPTSQRRHCVVWPVWCVSAVTLVLMVSINASK